MKEKLQNLLNQSLSSLVVNGTISALPAKIRIDHTKDQKHGDYATNVALILGKQNKCSPTELAKVIIEQLDESEFIEKMEIAGPGFINFFLSEKSNIEVVGEIISQVDSYGGSNVGEGQRVLLEFVLLTVFMKVPICWL